MEILEGGIEVALIVSLLETGHNRTEAGLSASNWTTIINYIRWGILLNEAELSDVILVNHSEYGSFLDLVDCRISHGGLSAGHQISLINVNHKQNLRNRHQG
jgi:hypothetical protein